MGLIVALPLNAAAMTMVGPPTAQSAGILGPGSLSQAMPIDEVTNRANALIAEWRAGDAKAADKLLGLLGAVALQVPVEAASKKPALPSWASQMADFRNLLGCDGSQMLVAFAINNRVGLAIVDMGIIAWLCPLTTRESWACASLQR